MNSGNSKTSDPRRLLFNTSDKINFKRSNKYIDLSYLSIYYTRENIKKSYKNSKIKASALTRNEVFELSDGSYSVSDIKEYLSMSAKNKRPLLIISSIKMYVNKKKLNHVWNENRILSSPFKS